MRRGGLEPPRCYPLAPQPNHRTRCHTIVSTCERLRGVIERDWGRQLAQKRHNLPASQNRPSSPWVEPHSPSRWKHFRKGTKRRASRASAPLRSTGLGLPSQDRSLLLRLSPTRCAARFMPLLLPTRTCRFGPVFTRATPPVLVPYITDMNDVPIINEVYNKLMPDPKPARARGAGCGFDRRRED